MKPSEERRDTLYLSVWGVTSDAILPLHSSIVLFLLSYCECRCFRLVLVTSSSERCWSRLVPQSLETTEMQRDELPLLVRSCKLPAVLDPEGRFCRAGLAVVLRCIVQRTCRREPDRRDVQSLLGFKSTCLKACAEVSQWTRLCELGIPSAVESFLQQGDRRHAPEPILHLERKLAEPVKVHNDDKIRRQKLQTQQKTPDLQTTPAGEGPPLELQTALSKLSVGVLAPADTRGRPDIRRVKTTELPKLEHVFAEGLYFTLTDLVLIPCVHHCLRLLPQSELARLTLLVGWYRRVQDVPGVRRTAQECSINFLQLQPCEQQEPHIREEEEEEEEEVRGKDRDDVGFVGGPRPTMTKLKESGIQAIFHPHPSPSWTVDWEALPAAVNPTEGKMSDVRALRKRQQLNNLVAMVTRLAHPGDTVVDFCSGGGHVGIVLAHTLPECQVVLIENKEESLVRAQNRCSTLGLPNISFIQANLDYFTGPFHIGVALHACGVATDMVLQHCVQAHAAFALSPCCYGFIQNTLKFTFPRSKRFLDTLSYKEHMVLCRFADQTAAQLPPERRSIGKQCMGLVDLDRSWAAEAHGYTVTVTTMEPESCSPKNNMLVGVPEGRGLRRPNDNPV